MAVVPICKMTETLGLRDKPNQVVSVEAGNGNQELFLLLQSMKKIFFRYFIIFSLWECFSTMATC